MNWDIIISVGIFVVGVVFFLIWQPTRVLLKEIIFHPFEDSIIKIVPKKDDVSGVDCKMDSLKGRVILHNEKHNHEVYQKAVRDIR